MGSKALSKEIEICDIDGTSNAHTFVLAEDRYGELLWAQDSVPAGNVDPGTELVKEWRYFGGGMGETYDIEERIGVRTGGYYFANNCQVSNPYRIRPRQAVTSVTLTNNNTEVTQMFEAASASETKYLYALTNTKAHKVTVTGTPALKNTKDFTTATVNFKTGSYAGTGVAQSITGVGFTPDAVVVKRDGASEASIRVAGMTTTKSWVGGAIANRITSLDADGFTVSTSDGVNKDGDTYFWMAWEETAGYIDINSYTGDGEATQAITSVGFQPDVLWLWDGVGGTTDTEVISRHSTHGANETVCYHDGDTFADCVSSLDADGFTVNNSAKVNTSAHTYWFIAFKALASHLTVGTYTGDGTDDQDLGDAELAPDVEYTPEYMVISRYGTSEGVHRSDLVAGDATMYFSATANAANLIQGLQADGCEVGDAASVNSDAVTYHCLAWVSMGSGIPILGQPAEWNSVWELPKGDDVDRAGLTTIADGTGDDTWTARSTGEPKVQHFHSIENQLVAARSDRMCSKCSALDTDVDANWTGDYNVGPPGTVITSLVNVAGEVGVATTDGFYLFDTVSTSRQQLPLLAGIKDDDNGKGTIVIGNLVLVPTADGLWRIVAGSGAQIGPDAQRDYVEIAGPSSIPIKLKHYGTAFLGTFIYHAVYDGTNYHIIYTRLDPYRPTLVGAKWDFLYTTTSAIKVLKVDSERRLWFSLANNIAYVTLERGGAPSGGAWGATDTNGSLTLPVTKMGTPGLKRLRMVEMQVVVATNFNWNCRVYRDGGTIATVGSAITANGLGECFWTAGTSDTAREIQLQPNWTTGTYTAVSTSPPEIRRVVLHAEPLEEDADVIVCSVKLSKPKEQKAIIDRHLNAGTLKLKNALTGVKETVHLFSRRVYQLQQDGNEPAIAACELRFRRSDTS